MNKERRSRLENIRTQLENLVDDLGSILDEEQESFDNLPEGLQQAERGSQMEENISTLEEAVSAVQEAVDTDIGNASDGHVTLILHFTDAKKLAEFVDEFLPVNAVAVEADSIDLQKIDAHRAYTVSTKAKLDGRKPLEVDSDEDPAAEIAEHVQEAVDNLDNVQ